MGATGHRLHHAHLTGPCFAKKKKGFYQSNWGVTFGMSIGHQDTTFPDNILGEHKVDAAPQPVNPTF